MSNSNLNSGNNSNNNNINNNNLNNEQNKLDEVIKSYLLSHGYHIAVNAMQSQQHQQQHTSSHSLHSLNNSHNLNSSLNIQNSMSINDITTLIVGLSSKEAKEQIKCEDFKIFYEWVLNSIDMIKNELIAVSFPIFVHRFFIYLFIYI